MDGLFFLPDVTIKDVILFFCKPVVTGATHPIKRPQYVYA